MSVFCVFFWWCHWKAYILIMNNKIVINITHLNSNNSQVPKGPVECFVLMHQFAIKPEKYQNLQLHSVNVYDKVNVYDYHWYLQGKFNFCLVWSGFYTKHSRVGVGFCVHDTGRWEFTFPFTIPYQATVKQLRESIGAESFDLENPAFTFWFPFPKSTRIVTFPETLIFSNHLSNKSLI